MRPLLRFAAAIVALAALVGCSTAPVPTVASSSPLQSPTYDELLRQAERKAAQGDLAGAVEDYTAVLARWPDSPRAYFGRGQAELRRKDFANALHDLNRSIAIRPTLPALETRVSLHLMIGDFEATLRDADQVVTIDPRRASAHHTRALVLEGMRRYAEAVKACDRAVEIDPTLIRGYESRAHALHSLGNWSRAEADYGRVLNKRPADADVMALRGVCRANLQEWAGALADFDEALRLNPRHVFALLQRGRTNWEMKRLPEALLDYAKINELSPTDGLAHFRRGQVLHQMGRKEAALLAFERAIELRCAEPDLPTARDQLKAELAATELNR